MSSGGAVPPQLSSPFGHFSYLFPQQPFNFHQQQHQRFKLKRQRQRVDAGEPRNSYQQQSKGLREGQMSSDAMTALFPWINQNVDIDYVKEEQPTDLSCKESDRHDLAAADTSDEIDPDTQLDVENTDEKDSETTGEDNQVVETRTSNESANSTSSSSKRKSFMPQRNMGDIMTAIEEQNEPEQKMIISEMDDAQKEDTGTVTENRETELPSHMEGLSALQSQLNTPNIKISEMFETQKRLYNNLIEQQKKMFPQQQTDVFQEKVRTRDYSQLAQSLKTEIIDTLSGSIDKVLKEWATAELVRLQSEVARPAIPMFNPVFPPPNPLAHFSLAPQIPPNGIFPSPFNTFNPLAALNSLRRPFEDDCPKKKRSKVTDSVRKLNGTPLARDGSPSSTRSSPQLSHSTPLSSYFPPTMVGHPLYGGAAFGDRDESPTNSDETSECGVYDSSQSSTLTPVHLRKAKLMFFYTRYPNSTLLKSYFPDVRFNKNNTAQLVKWFSNFREFYYIQMDKYARQALAEGISSREEIVVTMESEIFKTLNQHYNRNNHIQPPEKLVSVVQESLREFFDAIRLGKDVEPSWKKTIYKVINRLDDHIPEYFKDPNFLERLE